MQHFTDDSTAQCSVMDRSREHWSTNILSFIRKNVKFFWFLLLTLVAGKLSSISLTEWIIFTNMYMIIIISIGRYYHCQTSSLLPSSSSFSKTVFYGSLCLNNAELQALLLNLVQHLAADWLIRVSLRICRFLPSSHHPVKVCPVRTAASETPSSGRVWPRVFPLPARSQWLMTESVGVRLSKNT